MKWQQDEIDFMSVALKEGWTHKDIANELDRTKDSIGTKAFALKLLSLNNKKKRTAEYKKELPDDITLLDNYINAETSIMHQHICSYTWKAAPNSILSGHSCPKCAITRSTKTIKEYISQIPKDIIVLETYINAKTKILHKHICGHEWYVTPTHILRGKGCPKCADYGFQPHIPAVTYLIYFPEYSLYKFGISNNYIKRLRQFGSKPEIIFIREFNTGQDAIKLENQWSESLDYLKVNTGLLISGNTETFKLKA